MTEATAATGNPVKKMLFSMDCFLLAVNHSEITLTYFRLFWSLLIPLFYVITIIGCYILIKLAKKQQPKKTILTMTCTFLFLYY